MRIAFLLPDPGIPVGGTKGASVHVAEVCKALIDLGSSVTLLAQRVVGPQPDGVDVVHLDPGPIPSGPAGERARMRACANFADRAGPLLARLRPDLVYERLSLFFDAGAALACAAGAVRVVEVNAPVAAERERHFGLVQREAADRAERKAIAGARVIAVSEPVAAWVRQRGAAGADVVGNGVDNARFDPDARRGDALAVRRTLGLEDAELVGFTGSLKPWHGVDVLLDAAEHLAPHRPLLRVLVVGDGPCRTFLETKAKTRGLAGRVIFTGAVEPRRVPSHLVALDVVTAPFLPSDDFYFSPLKVVEAMAAGRPVIASRFGPIEAMLAGNGVVVPAGDAHALAAAIATLLDNPAAAARLGAAARRHAVLSHGWDGVARRILETAERYRVSPSTAVIR